MAYYFALRGTRILRRRSWRSGRRVRIVADTDGERAATLAKSLEAGQAARDAGFLQPGAHLTALRVLFRSWRKAQPMVADGIFVCTQATRRWMRFQGVFSDTILTAILTIYTSNPPLYMIPWVFSDRLLVSDCPWWNSNGGHDGVLPYGYIQHEFRVQHN